MKVSKLRIVLVINIGLQMALLPPSLSLSVGFSHKSDNVPPSLGPSSPEWVVAYLQRKKFFQIAHLQFYDGHNRHLA